MATIAQRIQEALRIRDKKQADLVRLTGIGKSSISTYLTGEYEPKQKNIYKIAEALNVNEAWLMGYDVPMERGKPIPLEEDRLDEELVKMLCQLDNQQDIDRVKDYVRLLKEAHKD